MAAEQIARMTVIMSKVLSRNLDLYCVEQDTGRGEVVREALTEFLTNRDYKPDQIPQLRKSWVPVNSNGANGSSNQPGRRRPVARARTTPTI